MTFSQASLKNVRLILLAINEILKGAMEVKLIIKFGYEEKESFCMYESQLYQYAYS